MRMELLHEPFVTDCCSRRKKTLLSNYPSSMCLWLVHKTSRCVSKNSFTSSFKFEKVKEHPLDPRHTSWSSARDFLMFFFWFFFSILLCRLSRVPIVNVVTFTMMQQQPLSREIALSTRGGGSSWSVFGLIQVPHFDIR